ncbi:Coatomer subunit beta', partial [Fragariocoptes setiger]
MSQPLKLDVNKKLVARSERVKCVDLHPVESWMLVSLYSGQVHIWNYETQQLIKTFEVSDLPVRASKFVAKKNWIVCGSDDMQMRLYNYNTSERQSTIEAHSDYIRCVVVHPTQPYVLTSSDDMLIKLWNYEKNWACQQVFEGHTHYVMQIVINPKDNNTFASASLDRTVKVWSLGSPSPNFTLEGHERGVNCVDYCHSGDKPYLISGADDRTVRIWDYQTKTCVQTLEGHAQNLSAVIYHPELPIILTASEDGTVKVWHISTYRLKATYNYGMERAWTMACLKRTNTVAIGYDNGSIVLKLGREEPVMSMDNVGKIVWAKHSELQLANLKSLGDREELKDGSVLALQVKDMGTCEIYPQTISHNPNGRFVVVCGDGEYIIHTALTLRNRSFGNALEFVWASNPSEYATRENGSTIKLFKDFKERDVFRPEYGCETIYGGYMLGVKTVAGLEFYDWETLELIRRIEIVPRNVYWSEQGELVCIATEDYFYILQFSQDNVNRAREEQNTETITEDGYEDAFDVLADVQEVVNTGFWVGDCFVYTNSVDRLNYFVGGQIVTIAHLDRPMYLLGYLPKENRIYLGDKDLSVVSYLLLTSVLNYQTAIMRGDFEAASELLPLIPDEQRTQVAHFLDKQGLKSLALTVSSDLEHKFDLAISLGQLDEAFQLAEKDQNKEKRKQVAALALSQGDLKLAETCFKNAQDYSSLLLLSSVHPSAIDGLAESAESAGFPNISFSAHVIEGQMHKAIELLGKMNKHAEAAFLSRNYNPEQTSQLVTKWKDSVRAQDAYTATALADPAEYENLFPDLSALSLNN